MSATHNPSPIEQGAQTRQRLLDVAETLFAEHGFAATSVRDITSAAACNLAAVNYHFRDKQNLYH
jgi:AcrR family transcriptional regulator